MFTFLNDKRSGAGGSALIVDCHGRIETTVFSAAIHDDKFALFPLFNHLNSVVKTVV